MGDETTFGCSMTFPLEYFQYGFYYRTGNVMLLAWDIPNMAYLSIINANDYRKNVMTEEMVGIELTYIGNTKTNILEVSI